MTIVKVFRYRIAQWICIALLVSLQVAFTHAQAITGVMGQGYRTQRTKKSRPAFAATMPTHPDSAKAENKQALPIATINFGTINQGELSFIRLLKITTVMVDDKPTPTPTSAPKPTSKPKRTSDGLHISITIAGVDPIDEAKISKDPVDVPVDVYGNIAGGFVQSISDDTPHTDDFHNDFQIDILDCVPSAGRENTDTLQPSPCYIAIGFIASQAGTETAKLVFGDSKQDRPFIMLTGTGTALSVASPRLASHFFPLSRYRYQDYKGHEVPDRRAQKAIARVIDNFDLKSKTIQNFYHGGTGSPTTVLSQINTVYNAAAGTETVGADIAALDFIPGIELAIGSTVQTSGGESSSSSDGDAASSRRAVRKFLAPRPAVLDDFAVPTLTKALAAQGAQNLINGGNLYLYGMYPIYFNDPSAKKPFNFLAIVRARAGVDIPNFAGTSTTTSSPVSHINLLAECSAKYNAIKPSEGKSSAGSVFFDGSAGYGWSPRTFSEQNGFGNRENFLLGQVTVGMEITDIISISARKYFAPSQTYINSDLTTPAQVTASSFPSWSLAINYAKKSSGSGGSK